MSDAIVFTMKGVRPRTKQSFNYGKRGGWTDREITEWQEAIGWEAKARFTGDPWEGEVHMTVFFYLPDNRKRDLDNLLKPLLDALNGIVYLDDKQVTSIFMRKKIVADDSDTGVSVVAMEERV